MNLVHFRLDPFHGEDAIPCVGVTGSIGRTGNYLSLSYFLSGDISQVAIPALSSSPERKDGLWEHTCFELFIAPEGSRNYWEFNMSPSGDWNVYHFSDYRQGMCEERTIAALPCGVYRKADCLSLSMECKLTGIISENASMEVAVSAVVSTSERKISYWALKHSGAKPDFHERNGFEIKL